MCLEHPVSFSLRETRSNRIVFKALANFQSDTLMRADILSEEYLEISMLFRDLCASICLVWVKGET